MATKISLPAAPTPARLAAVAPRLLQARTAARLCGPPAALCFGAFAHVRPSAGNPLLFLARLENESFESQLGYQLPQEASLHLRWVSQGVSLSTGRVLLNCVCVSPFWIIHTFAMLSCPLEAQIVKIPFNWAQSLEVRSSVLAWLSPQSF